MLRVETERMTGHGGGSKPEYGFRIALLADEPGAAPTIAEWVWEEWGYASRDDCVRELQQSRRNGIPSAYVALRGADPVGIVSLIACNLPTRCDLYPWLAGLYVRSDCRGHGIGSALVRFCESEAARLGFRRLYLYTESAEGFYRRLGWATIDTAMWEGEPVAIMTRDPIPPEGSPGRWPQFERPRVDGS